MDIESGTPNSNVVPTTSNFNFSTIPRISRWIVLIVVVLYFVTLPFYPNVTDILALVPSNFIPPNTFLWTAITAGFYHRPLEIVELIVYMAVVLLVTPSLDPIWGTKEILKFVLLVNFTCCIGTFVSRIIIFFCTSNLGIMFAPVNGFFGVTMGLLVAMKQINPEKEWSFSKASIRAKHLPFLFLILSLVHTVYRKSGNFEFGVFGLFTSWTYLRYFQYIAVKGDHSAQFKFATLFPEIFQPYIEFLIRKCCCCIPKKKTSSTLLGDDYTNFSVLHSPEDAERYRKVALRALDDKLQSMKPHAKVEETQKHTTQPETSNLEVNSNK